MSTRRMASAMNAPVFRALRSPVLEKRRLDGLDGWTEWMPKVGKQGRNSSAQSSISSLILYPFSIEYALALPHLSLSGVVSFCTPDAGMESMCLFSGVVIQIFPGVGEDGCTGLSGRIGELGRPGEDGVDGRW